MVAIKQFRHFINLLLSPHFYIPLFCFVCFFLECSVLWLVQWLSIETANISTRDLPNSYSSLSSKELQMEAPVQNGEAMLAYEAAHLWEAFA